MAIHYRTEGFIFKKVDFGEADCFFTIFTKDFGKLEILARAIRKINSKLRGGAQLFWLSEIEFIQGKTHKTLTDALLIENFKNIRNNLGRLKTAFQIAELFDKVMAAEEKDENLWNLLNEVFYKLNNHSLLSASYFLLYYYFFWNLFSILGYSPQLYDCVLCQKKLTATTLFFSLKEGGIICQNCFKSVSQEQKKIVQKIEPEIIKILRIILKKDSKTFLRLKIELPQQKALKDISKNYLSYALQDFSFAPKENKTGIR